MEKTTFERYREFLESPTMTEQIDYKGLLMRQFTKVQDTIILGDERIIHSAIWTLYNMIPENWKDEQFKENSEECFYIEKIDVRLTCGGVKVNPELCEELGLPVYREEDRVKYFDLLKECVDLFERLGFLAKKSPKAHLQGRRELDFEVDVP